MPKGYFTFMLHSHMPYVRQAGRWPHGEEMLHETIAETYIPLLNTLYDLRAGNVPFRLTIGITPILAEQIAEADVLSHFEAFLMDEVQRAKEDVQRFTQDPGPQAGHLLYLARFYLDWYQNLQQSFRDRFKRDLIGAFRTLQEEGLIEIVTSAATHGYLPLLTRDSTIYAQLKTGVTSYLRHFGRLPRGIWLPECGYRPALSPIEDQGTARPGLEEFLAELNLRYTFVDAHSLNGTVSQASLASENNNLYGWPRRGSRVAARMSEAEIPAGRTCLRPYYAGTSNVAFFTRDDHTGKQVWSAWEGYPGDFVYREFHRKDSQSGLQYWRITSDHAELDQKELYDPYNAFHRAPEHAAHFTEVVRSYLNGFYQRNGRPGIIVAAYDTELFGHWWFEGIAWMKEVLQRLSSDPDIAITTAAEYLDQYPPDEAIALQEGSWGRGGNHSTWLNETTDWMWPLLHEAERRMEGLVQHFPNAEGERLELLKQAARELLLAQSSDWPFLVDTQQAAEYATARFQGHLSNFNRLARLIEKDALDENDRAFFQECQHLDNPFLNVDYRAFAVRGEQASEPAPVLKTGETEKS